MRTAMKWAGMFLVAFVVALIAVPVSAHAIVTAASNLSPQDIAPHVFVAGATLGSNVATLADIAKRLDPDGKVPDIVELLSQTNEIIADMLWKEGNLPTGERTTIRTGLPTVYWRIANQGVPPSKSTSMQVDEQCGQLEAWSEVDKKIADLNGNTAEWRLSEAQAFIESMNQEFASTLIYGNASLSPEEYTGLAVRYSSLSAGNAQNILSAGGAGADNTSIWLVVWGQGTVHGTFPKGSKAGLEHNDYSEQTVQTSDGVGGSRLRVYQEQWTWECGLTVRDWRYVVRIANIDMSMLVANDANSAKLFQLLTKAIHRLPSENMGKAVFYCNRSIAEYLDIQGQDKVASGGQMSYEVIDGKRIVAFRGIPIRKVDAILETEAAVV